MIRVSGYVTHSDARGAPVIASCMAEDTVLINAGSGAVIPCTPCGADGGCCCSVKNASASS